MTDEAQAERIRQLQAKRAASRSSTPKGVRARPAGRRPMAVASRAVTGGVAVSAFVTVTAAMGPLFVDERESAEAASAEAEATVLAAQPPPVATVAPSPPPPPPDPPTTIVVQVRREYLVEGNVPAPAVPSPAASPAPAPAGAPTAAPTTTAAPAPAPPPPPPSPPAQPAVSSGS